MRIRKIEATASFFLLTAWLNYLDRQAVVPLAMVACALHELGHYLIIRWMGGNVKLIRLTAVGAEMVLSRPLNYWQEGAAALAGPGINLLLALVFSQWEWGRLFGGLNLVLGCFNLMPIGRLDGGRTMYCTLALLLGPDLAQRAAAWTDLVFTTLILTVGLLLFGFGGNVTLLLVAVWMAAILVSGKKKGNRSCQVGRKQVK